jgi:hypothetical protein
MEEAGAKGSYLLTEENREKRADRGIQDFSQYRGPDYSDVIFLFAQTGSSREVVMDQGGDRNTIPFKGMKEIPQEVFHPSLIGGIIFSYM